MTGQPILLGTWLGAVYWHTAEYTILYRCITLTARIWLLESSLGILISAFVLKQRVLVFNTWAEREYRYPSHPKACKRMLRRQEYKSTKLLYPAPRHPKKSCISFRPVD